MQTNTTPPARREEPEQEQTPPAAKRDWRSLLGSWFKRKEKPFDPEKALDRLAKLHSDLTDPWFNWQWKLAHWVRKRVPTWLFVRQGWTLFLAAGLMFCGWLLASSTDHYHSSSLGDLIQITLFLLVWGAASVFLAFVLRELLLRSPYLLEFKVSDPTLKIHGLSSEAFAARLQHRLHEVIEKANDSVTRAGSAALPIVAADGPGVEFEVAGRTQNLRHLMDSLRRITGFEGRRVIITLHSQEDTTLVSLSKPGRWTHCVISKDDNENTLEQFIDDTLEALLSRIDPLLLFSWLLSQDISFNQEKQNALALGNSMLAAPSSRAEGWMVLSRLAINDKDWDKAIDYATNALKLRNDNVAALFFGAYAHGELADAIAVLSPEKVRHIERTIKGYVAVLKRCGLSTTGAWGNWGIALYNLGKYEEAIEKYERAAELAPMESKVWYNWGAALSSLGKYEEAIEKYERAAELAPADSDVWYNLGNALSILGMYEEAIKKYTQAAKLGPTDSKVWNNWGNALDSLARYKEAIEKYERAADLTPSDSTVWYNWGDTLSKMGASVRAEAFAKFKEAERLAQLANEPDLLTEISKQISRLEAESTDEATKP